MSGAEPIFLLDANVLMTAHRSYYAFDLCPGFWESVKAGNAAGRVFSTQRVLTEIRKGNDVLVDWVNGELPDTFFLDDSSSLVASEYSPMMAWVASGGFQPAAVSKFATDADGWLVATAKQADHCLVTHEVRAEGARARVPMPNVCEAFGVDYCNTFEMLRAMSCCYR